LLDSIMIEKYAAMYQNMSRSTTSRGVYSTSPSANSQGFVNVPGRLFYPKTSEREYNVRIRASNLGLTDSARGGPHACQNRQLTVDARTMDVRERA